MDPDQWRQIERIYNRVLELEPDERLSYLEQACGNDELLRKEVEHLLTRQASAEGFMISPAVDMAARGIAKDLDRNMDNFKEYSLFQPGQTLLQYRIEEKLGQGGMGIVYKARDAHLNRWVALKVLPPEELAHPERKRRFIQEARAASALNHPHIITIHDISEAHGINFIAMEYVAGKTLGQLIGRKGLKLQDTLRYGIQIADALAKAHSAGIVHRDLKPTNIMVAGDGIAKLLDFGLAKLTEPAPADPGTMVRTMPHTEEGTILGTVSYMSPEQAEGKPVDARTDIFSFGALLHEMATGRRAFDGGSGAEIVSAILNREPPPIPDAPPEFQRIVSRCLRKDPERRTQSVADVKLALEDLREELKAGALATSLPPGAVYSRKSVFTTAGIVFALAVVVGAGYWSIKPAREAIQPPVLRRLTWDSGLATDPALSPDGKLLVYASNRGKSGESGDNLDLWVQQIGGGEPVRLTQDPANDSQPDFSPDGTRIAYRSERDGGGIYVVSALGGASRRITTEGTNPKYSPSGDSIAYYTGYSGGATLSNANNKLFIVNASGGLPREVRTGFSGLCCPIWTPDGTRLLFLGNEDDKKPLAESLDWWVVPVDGGAAVKTGVLERARAKGLRGEWSIEPAVVIPGVWTPQGDGVIFEAISGNSTNLWQIGINLRTYRSAAEPTRLTWGTSVESKPAIAAQAGKNDKSTVVFASRDSNTDIWGIPVSPGQTGAGSQPRRLTKETSIEDHATMSPDGRTLVFLSNRTGSYQVWLKNLDSGEQTQLTTSPAGKFHPVFSRDGTFLTYSTTGRWDIRRLRLSDGADDLICDSCGCATSWTIHSDAVFYLDVPGRVSLLDLSTRRSALLLAKERSRLIETQPAPDGLWILFTAITGGLSRNFIAPYRGPSRIEESDWIPIQEGVGIWRADGNGVYFLSNRGGTSGIWMQPLDPVSKRPSGPPAAVYQAQGAQYTIDYQCASANMLIFTMTEHTGSIWMAEWK